MAKPIPVFAFAFAAFAATSTKRTDEVSAQSASFDSDAFFLTMWRASARANAQLRVRVGVLRETDADFRLCERGSRAAVEAEWLWLAQIRETASGFSGVAAFDPSGPKVSRTDGGLASKPATSSAGPSASAPMRKGFRRRSWESRDLADSTS